MSERRWRREREPRGWAGRCPVGLQPPPADRLGLIVPSLPGTAPAGDWQCQGKLSRRDREGRGLWQRAGCLGNGGDIGPSGG